MNHRDTTTARSAYSEASSRWAAATYKTRVDAAFPMPDAARAAPCQPTPPSEVPLGNDDAACNSMGGEGIALILS
jgi:hypothetical protein